MTVGLFRASRAGRAMKGVGFLAAFAIAVSVADAEMEPEPRTPICEGNCLARRKIMSIFDDALDSETLGDSGSTQDDGNNSAATGRGRRLATSHVGEEMNLYVTRWAGTGEFGNSDSGGPPASLTMGVLPGLSVDVRTGNVLVVDASNSKIRTFTTPATGSTAWGSVTTVVGPVLVQNAAQTNNRSLSQMSGVVTDTDTGDIYFADRVYGDIFRLWPSGTITIFGSGAGLMGLAGDCGPGTLASVRNPLGLAILPERSDYPKSLAFADMGNNRIRAIEITDWPVCLENHQAGNTNCQSGASPVFIRRSDASNCSGTLVNHDGNGGNNNTNYSDCGFEAATPDECAFECRHFNSKMFPTKPPTVDISFSTAMLNEFLNSTYFDFSSPIQDEPFETGGFVLKANYTTENRTLQAGETLLGISWPPSGSKRFSSLLRLPSNTDILSWMLTKVPVTLRFRVNGECKRWMWTSTNTLPNSNQAGRCLFADNEVSCLAGSYVTGTTNCAPGRIRTVVGSAPPGTSEAFPNTVDLEKEDIGSVQLEDPEGLSVWTSAYPSQPNPTLMVADTKHGRIVAAPLETAYTNVMRFWLFVSGKDKNSYCRHEMTERTLSVVIETVLELKYRVRLYQPINRFAKDFKGDVCDGGRSWAKKKANLKSELARHTPRMCEVLCVPVQNSTAIFGFGEADAGGTECCKTACESCYQGCLMEHLAREVSLFSNDMCSNNDAFKQCLHRLNCDTVSDNITLRAAGSTCTADQTDDSTFFTALLNFTGGSLNSNLDVLCNLTRMSQVQDWDNQIFDILGGNHAFMASRLGEVNGLLMEVEFPSFGEMEQAAKDMSKWKEEELMSEYPGSNYDPAANPTSRFQRFAHLAVQAITFFHQMEHLSIPEVRFSISSVRSWDETDFEAFMTVERVPPVAAFTVMADPNAGNIVELAVHPVGVTSDKGGRLYWSDVKAHTVSRIKNIFVNPSANGRIDTTFGTTSNEKVGQVDSYSLALKSDGNTPMDLAVDLNGDLLVADSYNYQVNKITTSILPVPEACPNSPVRFMQLVEPKLQDVRNLNKTLLCRAQTIRNYVKYIIKTCVECNATGTATRSATLMVDCDMEILRTFCISEQSTSRDPVYNELKEYLFDDSSCSECDQKVDNFECKRQRRDGCCRECELCKGDKDYLPSGGLCNQSSVTIDCKICTEKCKSFEQCYWSLPKVCQETPDPMGDVKSCDMVFFLEKPLACETGILNDKFVSNSVEALRVLENLTKPLRLSKDVVEQILHLEERQQDQLVEEEHKGDAERGWAELRTLRNEIQGFVFGPLAQRNLNWTKEQIIKATPEAMEALLSTRRKEWCSSPTRIDLHEMLIMHMWYWETVYDCPRDGHPSINKFNRIPEYFYQIANVMGTLQYTTCPNDCGLLQIGFYDQLAQYDVRCCSYPHYRCKLGEGICMSNMDCEEGLSCLPGSCTWTTGSCCASMTASSANDWFREDGRRLSNMAAPPW
eukprot:TRINITY_DN4076_c0_g1_i9.p1 TRINITY_DN4076_c0_g1~~TRINITY_DN4076_c0_g1_i9.p1  ORF type:complete len:1484 (-),score=225.84 TRINITY_DN4076_c0_g1_i9:140-4591(-)